MKDQFPEFYSPKGNEFKKLWQEAIFVLDTNVLLSLYRYPPRTQAKLFAALKKLKNRLWIPHQVALEFHRRKLGVICTQEKTYGDMLTALERFEEQYIKHPFLFDKQITRAIKNACDIVHDELNKLDKARPKWLSDDRVLTNIEKIISNRVGLPYDVAKLKQVYIDGAERYEKEIPPGYKDVDKDKNDKSKTRKFGDLVIWYQIIDKAKEEQKPIIFVTDEQKEDWWWKEEGGRNMGARFELKKEMFDKTGMMLHMYQSDQFIEHSREHLNTKFGPEFIKEIKKAREILSNDTEQYVGLSASSVFNNILEESGSETLAQRVVGAVDASLSMGEAAQSIEPKHPENNDGKTTL